jgi:hypothetical protein
MKWCLFDASIDFSRLVAKDEDLQSSEVEVSQPLRECEDETHTPEMGTWESFGTLETSNFDFKGQNTWHSSVLYIIGKLSKCKCRKWACMNHLDIYSRSYDKKKGQKSNWQFDSRPLKVGNQPDPDVCRWSATCCWNDFNEIYKFSSGLVPIRGLSKEL